jgi:hypothetical protein
MNDKQKLIEIEAKLKRLEGIVNELLDFLIKEEKGDKRK